MIDFKKYAKISYPDIKVDIKLAKNVIPEDTTFVVTEKIHGANFSFTCDNNIKTFTRHDELKTLKEQNNFYQSDELIKRYTPAVVDITKFLNKIYGNGFNGVQIYGEIFGGSYNHNDVKSFTKLSRIQKGVNYIPHHDFKIFDMRISHEDSNLNNYISWKQLKTILNYFKYIEKYPILKAVPELFTGSFDECLNYKNDGESVVYKYYDLPKIDDNIMEGIVIKPYNKVFYAGNGKRIIFKSKNKKFVERSRKRKKIITPEMKEIQRRVRNITNKVNEYITKNRLRSVLSKMPRIREKGEFDTIMKKFIKDIFEDYEKENGCNLQNDLEKKEIQVVRKHISRSAAKILQDNIIDIINGEF